MTLGKAGGSQGAAVPAVHANQDARPRMPLLLGKQAAASPLTRW